MRDMRTRRAVMVQRDRAIEAVVRASQTSTINRPRRLSIAIALHRTFDLHAGASLTRIVIAAQQVRGRLRFAM